MAALGRGWGGFFRLTQVSGAERAGVPCQLRCKEECRLSAGSSLTPRSFSSGPQLLAIPILSGGTGNEKSNWSCIRQPREAVRVVCLWMWDEDGANPPHPGTKMTEWNCHYRLLNKEAQCDWSGFRQQFSFAFTPNDFWVSVPFRVHPLTPTCPCQDSLLGFAWYPVMSPARIPSIICHRGWLAITCLTNTNLSST